ncbi:MAG: aspartyl protease family protein [Saprospiraceae bacterium]|nr:aspartyl protease family protein [Saprospiraceae bacterium]
MKDLKTQWLYQNYANLRPYRGQYIAYDENGIIGHHEELLKLLSRIKLPSDQFRIYYVPKEFDWYQINMLKILPVHQSEWKPMYKVTLQVENNEPLVFDMLVDSGADISVISYDTGIALGLKETPGEILEHAAGIGGVISFALRRIQFSIDGYAFDAPVAWIQNQYTKDLILGREVVFDLFNITFKQADQAIIFQLRTL